MQDKLRDIYVLTLFPALAVGRGMPVEMRMRVYKNIYIQCHVYSIFCFIVWPVSEVQHCSKDNLLCVNSARTEVCVANQTDIIL